MRHTTNCANRAYVRFTVDQTRGIGGDNSYLKVPKFSDAKKLCCNLPKIQTKRTNLRVFCQKDDCGIANSEDPDQTAPLGAV